MLFHFYADDSKIYISFAPIQAESELTLSKTEACVMDVRSWMTSNKLKLNDSKTEFLVIGTPQQLKKVSIPHIRIGTEQVVPTKTARDLGTVVDENLKLVPHVSQIVKSTQFHLRNVAKIRRYLSQDSAEALIHSLITSRLDYGNALLFGIPKKQIKRLQRLQNTAARIVKGIKRRDNREMKPVLYRLHWLPVEQRIDYKILLTVFKSLHGLGPQYLRDLLDVYEPLRPLRSSSAPTKLVVPAYLKKPTLGERSFSASAPFLWNKLPDEIRRIDSLESFKSNLKSFLFSKTYNHLE